MGLSWAELNGYIYIFFPLLHLSACLPDELGNLKKLETLNLSRNSLATVPDSFVNLKSLRTVALSQNQFTTVPLCICQLTHADYVDLSANKIVIVPDGIQVISAVEINLNQNQINRIPQAIAACKRLKVLRLEENCLDESGIPPVVLADSTISLLCLEGNPLDIKDLRSMPEYDKVCSLVNGLCVFGSVLFECVSFCWLVVIFLSILAVHGEVYSITKEG